MQRLSAYLLIHLPSHLANFIICLTLFMCYLYSCVFLLVHNYNIRDSIEKNDYLQSFGRTGAEFRHHEILSFGTFLPPFLLTVSKIG